ncbi:MAG: MmcQ/YjbR family DNA-binding protein [Clostridia bacterium]|nr:MmcQ/YjbR family DNA-binding protein [Clostridia bacterium]
MDAYGFVPTEGNRKTVSVPFMEGDFRADVTVSEDGKVSGKVWDVVSDEEYLPVHIPTRTGAFVGAVREAYRDTLEQIAKNCCTERWFSGEQSSRIADRVIEQFGEEIDFPFSGDLETGVFRCTSNRKWYGIRMRIPRNRLKGEDGEQIVDVVNVKAQPDLIPELHKTAGIYPAYHMNASHWVTILLDRTVPDETVWNLLCESRRLALGGAKKASRRSREANEPAWWIVPANPAFYDVEAAFEAETEILWKQGRGIRPGDVVYLYVASPVSEIRYRCLVTETELPFSYEDEHLRMTHLMRIRKLQTYPKGTFPLPVLRSCGVKMLHGPRPVTAELAELLEQHND